MSKNKKSSKKNTKTPSQFLHAELEKADRLLTKNKPKEALSQLLKLNVKYPENPEVLGLTAYTYSDLKNYYGFLVTMLQLSKLVTDSEHIMISLAEAYLANDFRSLALQTYRQVYERWPYSENAPGVREII